MFSCHFVGHSIVEQGTSLQANLSGKFLPVVRFEGKPKSHVPYSHSSILHLMQVLSIFKGNILKIVIHKIIV